MGKHLGNTTKLQYDNAGFVDVANVVAINGTEVTREAVDCTDLSDTIKTVLVDIRDPGTVTFTIDWDPAETTHDFLVTSFNNGTLETWRIVWPDSSNDEFTGYVMKLGRSAARGERLQQEVDIALDGATLTLS